MTTDAIMFQPRLKVEWAKRHLDTLIAESAILPKDLHTVEKVPVRSIAALTEPDNFSLRYVPKKPVAEHFALIIGDIAHNLRSSLDYWITAVTKAHSSTKRTGRFSMPFGSDGPNLVSMPAYRSIEQALPDAAEFIRDDLQPYPNGNGDLLSAISRLNNLDKHEFILPTVTGVGIHGINLRFADGHFWQNVNFSGDATRELRILRSTAPFAMEQNFKTSVQVSFPQGSLFENQPAVPTLLNLIEATTKCLDKCEAFLRGTYP